MTLLHSIPLPQVSKEKQLTNSLMTSLKEKKQNFHDGPPFSIHQCLNQELESKQLPPIELRSFTGNPIYWPEFIENFKFCVHLKSTISIWKDYLVH